MKTGLVKPLSALLRRRHLRRLLALRRAWQQVIDGPDPDSVSRLASEISLHRLPVPGWLLRLSGLPRELDDGIEIALRQAFLTQLYPQLLPGLLVLVTNKPAALPLPAAWRRHLTARGLPLQTHISSLRCGAMAATGLARGMRQVLRTLISASRGQLWPAPSAPYDVAVQLPSSFLQSTSHNPDTVFIDWLQRNAPPGGLWLHSDNQAADTDRKIAVSPLPDFPDLRARAAFGLSAFRLTIGALIGLLVARPEAALLLPETVLLAHARAVGAGRLARNYVFENSRWFLRPLFTRWAAVSAGSQAVLAFYSTNTDECLRLAPTDRLPCYIPGYQSMDWDRYLVWDDHQADLLSAWGHDRSRATIVGPVPLTDSGADLPPILGQSLAVFDVAPFSPARLAAMGLVPEYYRDAIAADFLDDLRERSLTAGVTLVLKQKRERKRIGPPLYEAAVRRMLNAPHVIVLDPQISARRVVAACSATVSMPFSSPSLIAARDGKPTIFYDPTGHLIASPRQTHDLPLVHGADALGQWLQKIASADTAAPPGGNE